MGNKLYVTNIPFSYTDNQLGELFSSAGTVDSAKIITNKNSGRSRGYGFVEMGTEEEAQHAIEEVNGKEVDGRELKIAFATGVSEKKDDPGVKNKLYVGNLPFSVKDNDLADLFSSAGEIESAKINTDKMSGRSKGFGFVEMRDENDLQSAINKFDGYEFQGRQIKVNKANPKKPRFNK